MKKQEESDKKALMDQNRLLLGTKGKNWIIWKKRINNTGLEGKKILEFAEQLPEKEKRALIYSFADFCREMHSKGILHKDLKNEHVFVQQTPKGFSFALLDFGGTKIKKITTKDKISEFYRTEANFSLSQKKGLITNTDKLRFWNRYSQSRHLTNEEKKTIRIIMTKAQDARTNAAKGQKKIIAKQKL